MYDSTCRFLAEHFSSDFASWLLGEPIALTELKPSELSLEPIRVDALIMLQSDDRVLHIEFQTEPDGKMPFRMLDYRVRVYRRYPTKQMRQVVLYLQPTGSDLVQQTSFALERTRHEFDVVRLWEQPASTFLQYPGLLPLAVLGQTTNPESVLRQVAHLVEQISDRVDQAHLTATSAILAGLKLEEEVIYRLLRRDIMQESSVYRGIQAEEREKNMREVAMSCLREGASIEFTVRVTGLSIEEVQHLQQQLTSQS